MQVLLVTGRRSLGEKIAAALEETSEIKIAGHAATAFEAARLVCEQPVDLVLLSARLPRCAALKLTRDLKEKAPQVKILIIGAGETHSQIIEYFEAGAAGYIPRVAPARRLIAAIRGIKTGQAYLAPEVAAALIERLGELARILAHIDPETDAVANLTAREREILELLGQNLKNREIADRLVIEVGTVKNHVHSILGKLDVNSRREAAAYLVFMHKSTPG